jgi:hypothetical protein
LFICIKISLIKVGKALCSPAFVAIWRIPLYAYYQNYQNAAFSTEYSSSKIIVGIKIVPTLYRGHLKTCQISSFQSRAIVIGGSVEVPGARKVS